MKVPSYKAIAEGTHHAIDNAERFINSAQKLFDSKLYQDSYLLSLYSLEEMGKIILINNCLHYTTDNKRWKSWLNRFHDHGEKFWFSKDLDNIESKIIPHSKNKKEKFLKTIKESIAYVDFKNDKFTSPTLIDQKESGNMLEVAKKRLAFLKKVHTSIEKDEQVIKNNYEELKGLSFEQLIIKAKEKGIIFT